MDQLYMESAAGGLWSETVRERQAPVTLTQLRMIKVILAQSRSVSRNEVDSLSVRCGAQTKVKVKSRGQSGRLVCGGEKTESLGTFGKNGFIDMHDTSAGDRLRDRGCPCLCGTSRVKGRVSIIASQFDGDVMIAVSA
ncbi:hypothetical protein J6590_038695 [Homalodisca vitripennis]|nr:hypothetical protein J6590_038695 [Homalodisca vitripennis]